MDSLKYNKVELNASSEEELNDLLEKAGETDDEYPPLRLKNTSPATPTKEKVLFESVCQWSIGGNGKFMPVGRTTPRLQAGVYSPFVLHDGGAGLELMTINSDGIYQLPDMATETVLKEVETFWNNEALYRNHNLLYKRGVLLWGPPGSGKTITVKLLMKELIKRDGIVINVSNVPLVMMVLKALRNVEPNRNVILVLEDIDEIINYNGESNVLSLLDGEHNIDNVLNLATTNYPELLGARIINRPSRFDRRVMVDMPNAAAREVYLRKATKADMPDEDMFKWITNTEGMSIAHLRELVAAVYCLGQPFEDVVGRLKAMATKPKSKSDGFKRNDIGLLSNQAKGAVSW